MTNNSTQLKIVFFFIGINLKIYVWPKRTFPWREKCFVSNLQKRKWSNFDGFAQSVTDLQIKAINSISAFVLSQIFVFVAAKYWEVSGREKVKAFEWETSDEFASRFKLELGQKNKLIDLLQSVSCPNLDFGRSSLFLKCLSYSSIHQIWWAWFRIIGHLSSMLNWQNWVAAARQIDELFSNGKESIDDDLPFDAEWQINREKMPTRRFFYFLITDTSKRKKNISLFYQSIKSSQV